MSPIFKTSVFLPIILFGFAFSCLCVRGEENNQPKPDEIILEKDSANQKIFKDTFNKKFSKSWEIETAEGLLSDIELPKNGQSIDKDVDTIVETLAKEQNNLDTKKIRFYLDLCESSYYSKRKNDKVPIVTDYDTKLNNIQLDIKSNKGKIDKINHCKEKLTKAFNAKAQKTKIGKKSNLVINAEKNKNISAVTDTLNAVIKECYFVLPSEKYEAPNIQETGKAYETLNNNLLKYQKTLEEMHLNLKEQENLLSEDGVKFLYTQSNVLLNSYINEYEPLYVLYRNPKGETNCKFRFFSSFIDSKKNKDNDQENREVSALIFKKKDEQLQKEKKDLEILISFSGSNSANDWCINLNASTKRGNSVYGIRLHKGFSTSIAQSIEEMGANLKKFADKFIAKVKEETPKKEKYTIDFVVTGHSLGGALAQVAGYYIKTEIETYLTDEIKKINQDAKVDVNVKIFAFGAPPVFEKDSVKYVEDRIGKKNIIRIWSIGDIVANLSLVKQSEKISQRSLISFLKGYQYAGISFPVIDVRGLKDFWDIWSLMSTHLMEYYKNLLADDNSIQLSKISMKNIIDKLKSSGLIKNKLYILAAQEAKKGQIEKFIQYNEVKDNKVKDNKEIDKCARYKNAENIELLEASDAMKCGINLGLSSPKEKIELTFLGGKKIIIKSNLSCSASRISNELNKKYSKLSSDSKELMNKYACQCCLAKNFFVNDQSSLFRRIRRKNASKFFNIIDYCKTKQCNGVWDDIKEKNTKDDFEAITKTFTDMKIDAWKNYTFKNLDVPQKLPVKK